MGKFYKISSIISLNLSLDDKANIKRWGCYVITMEVEAEKKRKKIISNHGLWSIK